MGITNMYPNLPGHLVEFKDGGLQLTSLPEDGTGFKKSLLILGTALDGPINEPVKIDARTVTQLFGSEVNDKNYPNGTTLTKYAKQAFAHGFTDVRCMRVTGTEASKDVVVSTDNTTANVPKVIVADSAVAGHPTVQFSVVDQEAENEEDTVIGAYLPIYTEENCGIDICLAPPRADGSLQGKLMTDGITYYPSVGQVKLNANTVSKNAKVYAVFWHQNIIGKNDTHGASAEYLDEVIVKGNTATVVNASDFTADDPAVTFQLKYPTNDVKPYTQAFSGGAPVEAECYPQIWQTILQDDNFDMTVENAANLAVIAAKAKSNGLKVIINGEYEENGATKSRILDASEFVVDDESGNVVIVSGVYTAQVANPAYDEDNDDGTIPATITASMPYTSYSVKYLVYKKDRIVNTIDLAKLTGVSAQDDIISLRDNGEALADTIALYTDNGSLKVDSAKYYVEKDASNIHTVIRVPAGNAAMGTQFTVKYEVIERATSEKAVTFKSIYGGEVYNQARIKMEKLREALDPTTGTVGDEYIKITFCKPESKYYSKTEVPFYYKSTDVPTVGQLRDFLKNYELNNVFAIETDDDDITLEELYNAVCLDVGGGAGTATQAMDSTAAVEFSLVGGSNGVNPTDAELFVALSGKRDSNGYLIQRGAYQILENYHCDYIYPAGAKADKKVYVNGRYQSFQYELALVCAVLTYRTKMTHGFIDVSPNSNTSLVGVQKHVDKLLAMPNLFYMQDQKGEEILDSENQRMDIGWYTSVVVGPDPVMISDTLGTYYGSAAIAYAALVASLKPQSSPMNKALPKVKGMKYKFSNKQMDALIGNRMVCFRLKNEGAATASSIPYCVDAMTAGGPDCDYARMTTVSIVTDVVDQIREVADPFIGEPNTIEQRNALSALIAKRLSRIYEKGEVTYYSFEINATIQQVLLGECTISLTLVCPMELRKITTVVSLRAAA